jgi:hypothetical protein
MVRPPWGDTVTPRTERKSQRRLLGEALRRAERPNQRRFALVSVEQGHGLPSSDLAATIKHCGGLMEH